MHSRTPHARARVAGLRDTCLLNLAAVTRYGEAELAALPGPGRLGPDPTPVGGDDALADVQAQARTFQSTRTLDAVETLEDLAQLGLGEPNALVSHTHRNGLLVGLDRHVDQTVLGRVLRRVRQQVVKHLLQADCVPVTLDHRRRV